MKRFLSLLLLIAAGLQFAAGQSRELTMQSKSDYSQFVLSYKPYNVGLEGVGSNDYLSALFFTVKINNNAEGSFAFPENVYISGPFGTMNPIAIDINGQEWSFGKSWGYMKGNKGKVARVTLYFNRIPAGIDKIGFCMPNSFSWDKIPVDDNPDQVTHSDWDEGALRSYWESNKCGNIEGIYCFVSTNDKNWWGQNKHTFAIIKDGYQYDVVYIKGSNKGIWKEGDIKATFVPTATPGLYKATSWFMESRVEHDDFYLKFNNGSMTIFENTDKVSAEFLKLYPANDINDVASKDNSSAAGSSNSTYQNSPSAPKGSGSGIFVGEKIIATNYHVIEGAKKIEVSVRTGNSVSTYTANVLSSDKTNDLALISIDDKGFGGIGHIPFAVSGKTCDVGTSIFTMGYPMSDYMGGGRS